MKSIYNKWLFWLLMCPFLVMAQQGTLTGIISEKVSSIYFDKILEVQIINTCKLVCL